MWYNSHEPWAFMKFGFEKSGKRERPGSLWESYCLKKVFFFFFLNLPDQYWPNEDGWKWGLFLLNADTTHTHSLTYLLTPATSSGHSIASRGTMKMNVLTLFGIQKRGRILELEPDNYPRLFRLHGNGANWQNTHTHTHKTWSYNLKNKFRTHCWLRLQNIFFLHTQIKSRLRKINTLISL